MTDTTPRKVVENQPHPALLPEVWGAIRDLAEALGVPVETIEEQEWERHVLALAEPLTRGVVDRLARSVETSFNAVLVGPVEQWGY